MRIHFERSGGFSGMRFKATIDVESLPPEDGEKLREMIATADFFNLPGKLLSPTSTADGFQYTVTIEESDKQHTVEAGDQMVPDSLRPLLRRLELLARTAGRS